jgi:hypothetical protein
MQSGVLTYEEALAELQAAGLSADWASTALAVARELDGREYAWPGAVRVSIWHTGDGWRVSRS